MDNLTLEELEEIDSLLLGYEIALDNILYKGRNTSNDVDRCGKIRDRIQELINQKRLTAGTY